MTEAEVGSDDGDLTITFDLGDAADQAILAILLRPENASVLGGVDLDLDGNRVEPEIEGEEGGWAWVSVPVQSGSHQIDMVLKAEGGAARWTGTASAWLIYFERSKGPIIELEPAPLTTDPRPMPPSPWPPGALRRTVELGTADLRAGAVQASSD